MDKMAILQAEYVRASLNPVFDDPERYCVLLDLIQDEIDEENKKVGSHNA